MDGGCGSRVLQLHGLAESVCQRAEMVGTGLLGVVGDWSMGLLQPAVEDDGVTECLGRFRVSGDGFVYTTIYPSIYLPEFPITTQEILFVGRSSYGIQFVKKGREREK